jgi:hypothetical protein
MKRANLTAHESMLKAPNHPIVVNAPGFDETSGGSIVLHYLVDRIRSLGHDAYIFPFVDSRRYSLRDYYLIPGPAVRWLKNWRRRRRFVTNRDFDTPLAPRSLLKESIVVYPEIIAGNPLNARRVVRWLLHKPGFFTGEAVFGKADIFFYFLAALQDPSLQIDPANALRLRWVRDDIYRDIGLPGREGACRLIRKGRISGNDTAPDDGSILIDELSHHEKAELFNRTRFLYSHDPYTMYCFYAALCGCIPIVVPQPGMSREDWQPDEADRYGVAYGEEDIDWAIATRPLLIENYYREKRDEDDMVRNFLRILAERFP